LTAEPHRLAVRVYWEDTDAGGIVYHASYLRFMERGRTELLRATGVAQGALLQTAGLAFAVRSMTIDFLRAAHLDDELVIETAPAEIGGASIRLDQRVLRGDELLVSAEVRVACIAGGRPARIPAPLRARLGGAG
jgi:acyl-CoA thioester hydrolase